MQYESTTMVLGTRRDGCACCLEGWYGESGGTRAQHLGCQGGGEDFGSKEKGRGCRDLVSGQKRDFIDVGSVNKRSDSENNCFLLNLGCYPPWCLIFMGHMHLQAHIILDLGLHGPYHTRAIP